MSVGDAESHRTRGALHQDRSTHPCRQLNLRMMSHNLDSTSACHRTPPADARVGREAGDTDVRAGRGRKDAHRSKNKAIQTISGIGLLEML
jgi:hypothetical protein